MIIKTEKPEYSAQTRLILCNSACSYLGSVHYQAINSCDIAGIGWKNPCFPWWTDTSTCAISGLLNAHTFLCFLKTICLARSENLRQEQASPIRSLSEVVNYCKRGLKSCFHFIFKKNSTLNELDWIWDRVANICISNLGQDWFRKWLGTWTAPSYLPELMMAYCWLDL